MIIINGDRVTDTDKGDTGKPIGKLTDPNGNIVAFYSTNPAELAAVELLAIGRLPTPPALFGGGSLEVAELDPRTGQPIKFVYNASPNERDKAEIEIYKTKLAEWSTRAAMISKEIDRIVADAKPTTKGNGPASGTKTKKTKKKAGK